MLSLSLRRMMRTFTTFTFAIVMICSTGGGVEHSSIYLPVQVESAPGNDILHAAVHEKGNKSEKQPFDFKSLRRKLADDEGEVDGDVPRPNEDFKPKEYVPPGVVAETYKNSLWWRGGENATNVDLNSSNQDYIVAIATPFIILCVVLVIWFFILFLSCCVKLKFLEEHIAFTVSLFAMVGAFVAWFVALGGNTQAEIGATSMVGALAESRRLASNLTALADSQEKVLRNLLAVNKVLRTRCSPEVVPYPSQVGTQLEKVRNDFEAIGDRGDSIDETIKSASSGISTFSTARTTVTAVLMMAQFVLALIFLLAVVLRVVDPNPYLKQKFKGCIAFLMKSPLFIIGIALVTFAVLSAGLQSSVSLALSDICVSPDAVLRDFAADIRGIEDWKHRNPDYCENLHQGYENDPEVMELMCFYQTCAGKIDLVELSNEAKEFTSKVRTEVFEYAEKLEKELESDDSIVSNVQLCVSQVGVMGDQLAIVTRNIRILLFLISCGNVNPIYTKFLHDGLCTQILPGTILLWRSIVAASILFMTSFMLYEIYRFDNVDKSKVPCFSSSQTRPYEKGHSDSLSAKGHGDISLTTVDDAEQGKGEGDGGDASDNNKGADEAEDEGEGTEHPLTKSPGISIYTKQESLSKA